MRSKKAAMRSRRTHSIRPAAAALVLGLVLLAGSGCLQRSASPSISPTPPPPSTTPTYAPDPTFTPAPTKTPRPPATLTGVKNIREIGFVTGESSPNRTSSQWGVGGTDLGVLFGNGPYYMAFGDTFSSEGDFSAGWRSNVLAVIDDTDPSDGLTFARMIDGGVPDFASEIVPSRKRDNEEITVVPTGGFQIGSTLYLHFMSIRHWGETSGWECNFGGIWKSTDQGETWSALPQLRWPGDSGFVQAAPLVVGDLVYFWCIPSGRSGGLSVMRVPVDSVEDIDAYEYFQGSAPDGSPLYATGEAAMRSAGTVAEAGVSEPSVVFNEYLDQYLLVYLLEGFGIVAQSSDTPEGPFEATVLVLSDDDYPYIYGGFMHPALVADGGRRIYFALSQWLPTYNVRWMEVELVKREVSG